MTGINETGAAIHALAQVYFQAGRQTGRTTAMIAALINGDTVVFTTDREARRVHHLCNAADKRVDCVVASQPDHIHGISRRALGRVFLDHAWVERAFMDGICQTTNWLNVLTKEPPRETSPILSMSDILTYPR